MNENGRWQGALSKPVTYVLSGGASLGAIQIGMMRALQQAGIVPDLIVGSSVGALNGSVIADKGLDAGLDALTEMWLHLSREDVFPGSRLAQARQLLASRVCLFPNDKLVELGCRMLTAQQFADLQIPLGVLATELKTRHGALFVAGDLHRALLASAAIPGIFPPVSIQNRLYIDGGLTANVPLAAAVQLGAGSLVVLDAGENCHLQQQPRHVAEILAVSLHAALRQRVRVEAPLIAANFPLLYLPTPCSNIRGLFDFSKSQQLLDEAYGLAATFLETAAPPVAGKMIGSPHFHQDTPVSKLTKVVAA